MASSAGSPSFSDSSGGSDLMALLDQELEIENVEAAEQDNASSAAETCAEKLPNEPDTLQLLPC